MKFTITFLLSFVFALPVFADQAVPIDVFAEVTAGVYRGARPERVGLEALKKMGVKTIINIDDDDEAIAEEAQNAKELGLNMISKPLSGFWAPSDEDVDAILNLLHDPSLYPVFVHCQHGQDRTGMIVGFFRVYFQQWKPEDAYQEMLDFGFHPELFLLNHYFRDRVGL
jgi:tyrosine-protein phosphatase SIW14